jgi:hypothetical protein
LHPSPVVRASAGGQEPARRVPPRRRGADAFLAQVGKVRRRRCAGHEHKDVESAATLRMPPHAAATVDDRPAPPPRSPAAVPDG